MTNQQALEALNEYSVASRLIEKILLDRGVSASATYTGSDTDRENIDLAYADICMALVNNPDIQEGSQSIAFDRNALIRTAQSIYMKYQDERGATINGTNIW